jgi:hypothetical protein
LQLYDKACRDIADFHPNILATGVAKDAAFLAHHFKERTWIPKPDRLTVMLGQVMVMTGIPELNEDFFGKTRVVTIQHDKMHVLLFPAGRPEREDNGKDDSCVIVVVVMPPFQHEELVDRILGYLRMANICPRLP